MTTVSSDAAERFFRPEPGVIKICGLTTPEDAASTVEAGADAIGINFYPGSKRYVVPHDASSIADAGRGRCAVVGVFLDEDPARVVSIAEALDLDAVQLHGGESQEIVAWVAARTKRVIKAFTSKSSDFASAPQWGVDPILVDAAEPGSGETFDWDLISSWEQPPRLLLAGGLHPGNVAAAVATARPWGVDVASGVESSPGRKDPALVREFVAAARAAYES